MALLWQVPFAATGLLALMQLDDPDCSLVQAADAAPDFFMGRATLLAGVSWQLDAADSEHLPVNQLHAVAGDEHLAKELPDLGAKFTH